MKIQDIRTIYEQQFIQGNLQTYLERHKEVWEQLQVDHPMVANAIQAYRQAQYLMELALNDLHDTAEREADEEEQREIQELLRKELGEPDA